VQSVRILNPATLLTAYQAQLLEEMGHQLDAGIANPTFWEEICLISDLILRAICCGIWGLSVVGERSL